MALALETFHTDDNYGYGDRGYYDRDYNQGHYDRDYYGRSNYGGWYGGSGVYFGGGSHDFRWGVGIPFGYDDYDWYAPYYNDYSYITTMHRAITKVRIIIAKIILQILLNSRRRWNIPLFPLPDKSPD